MLNDIKFLYYLWTNYTLKEIKILFQIVHLLPKMIFEKYHSNILPLFHQEDKMFLSMLQMLFLFGRPGKDREKKKKLPSYMTDCRFSMLTQKFKKGEPGKVSGGDADKIFKEGKDFIEVVKITPSYPEEPFAYHEFAVTAGSTLEEREEIARKLEEMVKQKIQEGQRGYGLIPKDVKFIAVSPLEEFEVTLASSNTTADAVLALGTSTGHFAPITVNPDGRGEISGDYVSFDMKEDNSVVAMKIATSILEIFKVNPGAVIHVCGSPTRMFSEEEWDAGLGGMFLFCSVPQFQEKIEALGERGENAIRLVKKICGLLREAAV